VRAEAFRRIHPKIVYFFMLCRTRQIILPLKGFGTLAHMFKQVIACLHATASTQQHKHHFAIPGVARILGV